MKTMKNIDTEYIFYYLINQGLVILRYVTSCVKVFN